MTDELERIEARLRELTGAAGRNLGVTAHDGYEAVRAVVQLFLQDHIIVQNRWDQEECNICGELWPCQTVDSVMTRLGLEEPTAVDPAPTVKTPLELAEGIRRALQDVATAGYRTWMHEDGDELGIQRTSGGRLMALVSRDDGAWTVQTWQDAR